MEHISDASVAVKYSVEDTEARSYLWWRVARVDEDEEVTDPHATHARAPEGKSTLLAKTRIVIVEDDDDAREVLALLLQACGARVIEAASASEALDALGKEQVDLLISDLGLPGRDGYALIREVRATSATAKVPAVALTAFTSEQSRSRALEAGFDVHLSKPMDAQALVSVAASLIHRRP